MGMPSSWLWRSYELEMTNYIRIHGSCNHREDEVAVDHPRMEYSVNSQKSNLLGTQNYELISLLPQHQSQTELLKLPHTPKDAKMVKRRNSHHRMVSNSETHNTKNQTP